MTRHPTMVNMPAAQVIRQTMNAGESILNMMVCPCHYGGKMPCGRPDCRARPLKEWTFDPAIGVWIVGP